MRRALRPGTVGLLAGLSAWLVLSPSSALAQAEDPHGGGQGEVAYPDPAHAPEIADPQVFHEALSPHGEWISLPPHGRVWRPFPSVVGAGWRPYTRGRWVYTRAGWTWVSDFRWGWAPFHYGRWLHTRYGWVWVPGRAWAPAWVHWRVGDGYTGWAPLPPRGIRLGLGYWTLVPTRYLLTPHVALRHRVSPRLYLPRTRLLARGYVVRPGLRYYVGPRPYDVSRYYGRRIYARPFTVVRTVPPRLRSRYRGAFRVVRPYHRAARVRRPYYGAARVRPSVRAGVRVRPPYRGRVGVRPSYRAGVGRRPAVRARVPGRRVAPAPRGRTTIRR